MYALDIPVRTAEDAGRLVRALGSHRYVSSRLHLVHAFAIEAAASAGGATGIALDAARGWATATLENAEIDIASRDPRLYRASTDAELAAVLEAFWSPATAPAARSRLDAWLTRAELPVTARAPFDEADEEEIHPLLVDAGWELLPLASLDAERHKGVIGAFGEAIDFEAAKFEEESAIPKVVYLHELPAMGPVELLHGADDDGALDDGLTVWASGHDTYHDYLLRGVCRAAKLDPPE